MEYAFDLITPEQALAIGAGDTLTITGPARAVRVAYQHDGGVALTFAGRTVVFGAGFTQMVDTGGLVTAAGTRLFVGDAGHEAFRGGEADDALFGGAGDDTLDGAGGSDLLQGNAGNDELTGGEGADQIYGGQGNDVIRTGVNAWGDEARDAGDFANGNLGDDEIVGAGGRDTLLGGQGADFLQGLGGNDFLSGDLGDDQLWGGGGDDTLVGGVGDDVLQGGFGGDRLSGGDGHDTLVTQGNAATTMDGGSGNDTIVAAGSGQDWLWGGVGRDQFVILGHAPPAEGQDDMIFDWEVGDTLTFPEASIFGAASILPREYSEFVATSYAEALRIANEHMAGGGAKWVAAQVGDDVIVFADVAEAEGADKAVVLVGRTLADIDLGNFI